MKSFSHRETCKSFLLIFWTFHLLSLIQSQLYFTNVKVGLVSDRRNHGGTSVENYEVIVDDYNRNTSSTKTSLQIKDIPFRGLSVEKISRTFCSRVLQDNVTVLILQSRNEKLARFVGHLASYFKIPVIGSINQAPLLSDKGYFSTFVRNIPSSTFQFIVFCDLLRYVGKRQAFVVVSDDTSYGLALQHSNDNEFISLTIIHLRAPNIQQRDIIQQLQRIKSSTTQAVYLYCDSKLAHFILWLAKDFRLINDDILWILSEKSLQNVPHNLHALPSSIYLIRTENFSNEEEFERRHLIDSLSIVRRTFDSMEDEVVLDYLRKSTNCFSSPKWTKGQQLYELLLTEAQSRVASNMKGKNNHESLSYEILYLQTPYQEGWVQVGRSTGGRITFQTNQLSESKEEATTEIPQLRAAVVEYPPLTMKTDFDASVGCYQGLECKKYIGNTDNFTRYCCYGLAIDVLRYVKTELQFEPLVYFVRDGNYGAKNSTANTWNGIVRDILDGKADIAIDLMTNEARSEVIDFSLRWTHAGLALLVLVGEQKVEKLDFSFFHPFTSYLWMSMIGVVNFYLGILWYTDRLSPYGHYKSVRAKNHNGFDLSESMWYCWGVCFDNQFVDSRPRSLSARAMAVFLAIFALMCVTSYTANLTAHLLSDDTKPEVTGIRDPKITSDESTISYGVVKSSYVDSYFELNEDPVMQSMFRRMRDKKHLVDNFTDGVERVRNKQLDIFISEVLSIDYEVAKQKSASYPRLQVVGASAPFAESGYSYAFKKDSLWKPKFDLVVNRMKAENLPSELYKKWVSSGEDRSEEHHQRLAVRALSGVFFLGASLAVVAIFFLFLENKLFAKGFIYNDMRGDCVFQKGQRKYSAAVKRKLLDYNKDKDEAIEYPDISGYLHKRRRTNVMLKSLYNPKSVRRKYEEAGENFTASSSV